ncbi:MAG: glycoside hydrolase family 140 protein [Verrucomicrobiales bacterium]
MRTIILLLSLLAATADVLASPRLKVSDNKRFLVREDGKPFFWLGDTAWELFHRLNREEAEHYLRTRAAQGFTVIQAVVLAELDGLNTPNANGDRPLIDNDPTKPEGKYFQHVDWIVAKAGELGLFIGMLPTWGDKWHNKDGAIFRPENAAAYGEWLGRRYKEKPIIWILGGDRVVENDQHKSVIRAMAEGLRKGDGGNHLMTFHPTGGRGSAEWFHEEAWLDFNMRQNGHVTEFGRYEQTRADYDRQPVKPVLDGEPIYEDHPISFKAAEFGHSVAADVRRPLYWDLFQGGFGHTYGNHCVWQMWAPGRPPINNPLMPWREALEQPGARQMQFGRKLLESRPFLTRVPDDSIIVPSKIPTDIPGAGTRRFVATRDESGAYAMIYAPISKTFSVHMDKITGTSVTAWWYNPRNGEAIRIGDFPNTGTKTFTPPQPGEQTDWILVLDDALKKYTPPGQPR